MSGQVVNFKVTEGGGSVFPGVALTDATGQARERWTLGPAIGLQPIAQKLDARAVDSQTGGAIVFATLEAASVAHPPRDLTYAVNSATCVGGTPIPANAPAAAGGPALRFAVAPALPPELELGETGIITGTPTAAAPSAVYVVTAFSSGGSATVNLGITVAAPAPPVIVTLPASASIVEGESGTFTVAASGVGALTYSWRRNGVPIDGAVSATYVTPPQDVTGSEATFIVVVSDAFGGATTSAPASLTVAPGGFWATGSLAVGRYAHTARSLPGGSVLVVGGRLASGSGVPGSEI